MSPPAGVACTAPPTQRRAQRVGCRQCTVQRAPGLKTACMCLGRRGWAPLGSSACQQGSSNLPSPSYACTCTWSPQPTTAPRPPAGKKTTPPLPRRSPAAAATAACRCMRRAAGGCGPLRQHSWPRRGAAAASSQAQQPTVPHTRRLPAAAVHCSAACPMHLRWQPTRMALVSSVTPSPIALKGGRRTFCTLLETEGMGARLSM